mmetsp:Transcript_1053/g.1395  ORF Transcript_1053/g.1395 Transcript_1053/m.1395 type:complete len:236 (+) Transcript_1053:3-710(+)
MEQSFEDKFHAEIIAEGVASDDEKLEKSISADEKRKRSTGLRDFASMVCEKVQKLGRTTYNKVSDEIIEEIAKTNQSYDEKNIRRRIYDVLNVFMALDMIQKDNKNILWQGFPAKMSPQKFTDEAAELLKETKVIVKRKREKLDQILGQVQQFKKLARRNTEQTNSSLPTHNQTILPLPFLLCVTSANTQISCKITQDKRKAHIDLTKPFELHDQTGIIQRLFDESIPTTKIKEL